MNNIDFRVLFDRRPTEATVALSLTSLSAIATLFQGLTSLLGVSGFYFDFIYRTSDASLNWKMGVTSSLWAIALLYSSYKTLNPNPIARFSVLGLLGYKILAFLSASTSTNLPVYQIIILVLISVAPVLLLLTPNCNRYYAYHR